jgi:ABC-2 type transport system ATP-binding protein
VGDPDVLILDEPTEGLDPNQRSDIRSLLSRLAKKKTVLVSTHVLAEAEQMANKVIVLNKGAVASVGTVGTLLEMGKGRTFTMELEGNKPEKAVQGLASVASVDILGTTGDGRVRLSVVAKDGDRLPRELSNLIGTHKLTLWRLEPDAGGLERAFSELTREPRKEDVA